MNFSIVATSRSSSTTRMRAMGESYQIARRVESSVSGEERGDVARAAGKGGGEETLRGRGGGLVRDLRVRGLRLFATPARVVEVRAAQQDPVAQAFRRL